MGQTDVWRGIQQHYISLMLDVCVWVSVEVNPEESELGSSDPLHLKRFLPGPGFPETITESAFYLFSELYSFPSFCLIPCPSGPGQGQHLRKPTFLSLS
jgi:hypothetical protein